MKSIENTHDLEPTAVLLGNHQIEGTDLRIVRRLILMTIDDIPIAASQPVVAETSAPVKNRTALKIVGGVLAVGIAYSAFMIFTVSQQRDKVTSTFSDVCAGMPEACPQPGAAPTNP